MKAIVNLAVKLENKLLKGKQPFFKMSVEKQHRIIEKFKEPSGLIERSYYQYLCQMKQTPLILKTIQNLAALILAPIIIINILKIRVQRILITKKVLFSFRESIIYPMCQ